AQAKEGPGVTIEQVLPGSVAEQVKLKPGETIVKIDDVKLTSADKMREVLAEKKPDELVTLTLLLAEKQVEMKVRLGGELMSEGRIGLDTRGGYWTRPVYRVAIICVEYPDVKHNPKIPVTAWEEAMFSHGMYTKTSVTGQTVHGSMHDYYLEQSCGKLKVEGKA